MLLGQNVTCVIFRGNAGVDINAIKSIAKQAERQIRLNIGVLGNGACKSVCNGSNRVRVCIVPKGRETFLLGIGVKHCHAHTVIIGNNDVNLVAKVGCPCGNGVTCSCGIPCGTGRVLHFLRRKLTDYIRLAVCLKLAVLNNRC